MCVDVVRWLGDSGSEGGRFPRFEFFIFVFCCCFLSMSLLLFPPTSVGKKGVMVVLDQGAVQLLR